MDIQLQETTHIEEVLTPLQQLQRQWQQQPGFIPLIRQKNVIDQNAELLPYANRAALPGWASPRVFALQGLVIAAIILSFVTWYETRHRGKLEEDILAVRENVSEETKRQSGITSAALYEKKRILTSPNRFIYREEALRQADSVIEDSRKSLQQYQEKKAG